MPRGPKLKFVSPKYPRRPKRRSLGDPFYFDPEAWALLEAEVYGRKLPTQKGDKRPPAEIERKMASQRANKLRRQEAILEVRQAELRSKRYRGPALSDLVLAKMDAGLWYGERDVIELTGLDRDAVHGLLWQRLRKYEWIVKRLNPAFEGKLDPWQRWSKGAGNVEPRVLWGLTEKGANERLRAIARLSKKEAPGLPELS